MYKGGGTSEALKLKLHLNSEVYKGYIFIYKKTLFRTPCKMSVNIYIFFYQSGVPNRSDSIIRSKWRDTKSL